MRRREFIVLVGGAAVTWPLAASAQQQIACPRSVCSVAERQTSDAPFLTAFQQGLRDGGFVEGRNVAYRISLGR